MLSSLVVPDDPLTVQELQVSPHPRSVRYGLGAEFLHFPYHFQVSGDTLVSFSAFQPPGKARNSTCHQAYSFQSQQGFSSAHGLLQPKSGASLFCRTSACFFADSSGQFPLLADRLFASPISSFPHTVDGCWLPFHRGGKFQNTHPLASEPLFRKEGSMASTRLHHFLVQLYACTKQLMCWLHRLFSTGFSVPSMERRVLLNLSGWGSPCGWYGEVLDLRIPSIFSSSLMRPLSKSRPWSEWIREGKP